jgi:hypothetical protein
LKAHQLSAAAQHNLAEILQTVFQLTEHLLGVAVGPILNRSGILAGASHKHITLLLSLLSKLDGFLMEPLGLSLAVPLNPQAFLTDGFQLLEGLLTNALMLLHQLAGAIHRLGLQLGATLLGFLLQLLAAGRKGLIHLRHPPLVLLLGLGRLGAGLGLQLLRMEARLLPHIGRLALSLLAHGRGGDELLTLPSRLGDDLLRLLLGLLDEAFPFAKELISLGNLKGESLPEGVHCLNGVLLIHKTPTTEGNTAAVENDLLKLIELIKNRDARLGHVNG